MDVVAVEQACERLYTAPVRSSFFYLPLRETTVCSTLLGDRNSRRMSVARAREAFPSSLTLPFGRSSVAFPLPPLSFQGAHLSTLFIPHIRSRTSSQNTLTKKTHQDAAQRASAEEALAPFRGGVASIGPCKVRHHHRSKKRERELLPALVSSL